MATKKDLQYDPRVGDIVDPETGQVGPDDAPEWQTAEFDGNGTGWHRDGQPVAPFPRPDGGKGIKTDHFQAATVAPAISDELRSAVQRVNRGDAGRDDPRILDADRLRRGDIENLSEDNDLSKSDLRAMTKAAKERQAADEKARADARAEQAVPVEVVKKP